MKREKHTWILGILLLISILIMQFFDTPLKNEICTNGIISFELAKELPVSINIINSWNLEAKSSADKSLIFDFFFLLVYASFIALLIQSTKNYFKKIAIYLILIAAFLDVIENIALLNLLHGNYNQIWSSIAFYFASMKFILILICLVYLLIYGIFFLFQKIKTAH